MKLIPLFLIPTYLVQLFSHNEDIKEDREILVIKNQGGDNILQQALKNGEVKEVVALLQKGIDPNYVNKDGERVINTALKYCKNNKELLNILLSYPLTKFYISYTQEQNNPSTLITQLRFKFPVLYQSLPLKFYFEKALYQSPEDCLKVVLETKNCYQHHKISLGNIPLLETYIELRCKQPLSLDTYMYFINSLEPELIPFYIKQLDSKVIKECSDQLLRSNPNLNDLKNNSVYCKVALTFSILKIFLDENDTQGNYLNYAIYHALSKNYKEVVLLILPFVSNDLLAKLSYTKNINIATLIKVKLGNKELEQSIAETTAAWCLNKGYSYGLQLIIPFLTTKKCKILALKTQDMLNRFDECEFKNDLKTIKSLLYSFSFQTTLLQQAQHKRYTDCYIQL